jgi:hypothetical protein
MELIQKIYNLNSISSFKATKPNYMMIISSLSLIFPAIICYMYNQYLMSTFCAMLTLTSVQYHGNPGLLSFLLDQIMIGVVVIHGINLACQIGFLALLMTLLFDSYCIFIYYGPYSNRLTYHPNEIIGNIWHGSMHVILAFAICIAQPFLI